MSDNTELTEKVFKQKGIPLRSINTNEVTLTRMDINDVWELLALLVERLGGEVSYYKDEVTIVFED